MSLVGLQCDDASFGYVCLRVFMFFLCMFFKFDARNVFAVCSLAAGSAAGQTAIGTKRLSEIGCAICEWHLNAGDRAALRLIPNAGLLSIGLHWHNDKYQSFRMSVGILWIMS